MPHLIWLTSRWMCKSGAPKWQNISDLLQTISFQAAQNMDSQPCHDDNFQKQINTYIINISAVRIQHLHRSWSELLHGPLYFCICAIIRILASFAWLFASQFSAIELLPGTMSTMSRSLKSELGKMLRGNSYRKHAKAHTIYLGGALVTLDIKQGGFGWVGRGFCFPTSDFWRFCEKKI